MPTLRLRRVAALVCLPAALTLAACFGSGTDSSGHADDGDGPVTLRLYGTDGTMANDLAEGLHDRTVLAGMKGTRPMPVLPTDFVNRLHEVDSSLQDLRFAGETYDAIVISALAAELAGTPDPEVVRTYIKGVTTGGQQCRTVADCLELARDGQDLAYRGVSLTDGFTDKGEPAATTYETAHFGAEGFIDPGRSEFIGAGDTSQVTSEDPPDPDPQLDLPSWEVEPLVFGGLLPETGGLAFAYPPLIAAAQLAIDEVNDAGGVFGVDVEWLDGDSGTDPEVARDTLASHLDSGVHVLIGPAASGVTSALMEDMVAARRIIFSPSNTAAELVDADHDSFYFRTAPPDTLQGAALADILLRDGMENVVIVARDDSYGTGLQSNTIDSLQRFGVPSGAVTTVTYALPEEADGAGGEDDGAAPLIPGLDQVVDRIIEARADAVVLIGFEEAAQLIERLRDEGVTFGR